MEKLGKEPREDGRERRQREDGIAYANVTPEVNAKPVNHISTHSVAVTSTIS